MILLAAPPTLLFMLLAFYNRDGQDFEHLLVAVVGYFAASRYRLWVKEELVETFHIEPTKHAAEISQRNSTQVIGELEKLATLLDSRGWNLPASTDTGSHLTMPATQQSDRIIAPPAPTPHPDGPHTDMLDLQNSPLAQNLAQLQQQAASDVRQQAVTQMTSPMAPAHHRPSPTSISGVTAYPSNDILRLATQSDDLSVAQVAAQATRLSPAMSGQMVEPIANGR
jgi:hypothetical protein